jgi:ankyrin repeat protein
MTRYRDIFLQKAIEGDALDVVNYIFGSSSFQKYTKGFYLHFAAMKNALKVVTHLVGSNEFHVNFANEYGFISLHFAAFANALNVVKYLASQQNVDINALNKYGRTPLHQAVMGESIETVKYLTEIPDVDIVKDLDGKIPLHLAVREQASTLRNVIAAQMYDHLKHKIYAELNPIHLAILKKDDDSLEDLLKRMKVAQSMNS